MLLWHEHKKFKEKNVSFFIIIPGSFVGKYFWGNYQFDHIVSEALGYSGGILCVWDYNVFHKKHHIISDNFVALYGTWIPRKIQLLIISVYAPQSYASKCQLWDFIASLINQWNGECMVMGVSTKLDVKKDSWGYFLAQGAYGFLSLFPHISAVCLDRHLSDHRPILLRGMLLDFGATPFRLYHSWLSIPGFDQMITSTWNSFILVDSNGMIRFKKKLQLLKKEIRKWVAEYKNIQSNSIRDVKNKLSDIDKLKRANLSVKGIMIEGEWVDDPIRVKDEFRNHFADRFNDPGTRHGRINFSFPNFQLNLSRFLSWKLRFRREFAQSCLGCDEKYKSQILLGVNIQNQQAMFIKVDFAKSYDSIRWDYLDDVLNAFGFGSRWRSWIQGSLNSGKASVLVNGSPTSEFQFHRGLKQGDPLAPFLFIFLWVSSSFVFLYRAVKRVFSQAVDVSSIARLGLGYGVQHSVLGRILGSVIALYQVCFIRLFALDTEERDIGSGKLKFSLLFLLIARNVEEKAGYLKNTLVKVKDASSEVNDASSQVYVQWLLLVILLVLVLVFTPYFLRDCMVVVKEIVSRLLEEVEKLEWWFEQDIDDEEEEDEEGEGGSEV
ncbi:RNA-directed DNA polymerase, eukaryota [Tanacetum coccineum]